MPLYPSISDMLPRPIRWRTIADYAVYSSTTRRLMICPALFGFKHVEASFQCDGRREHDARYGLNVAEKYIPIKRGRYGP